MKLRSSVCFAFPPTHLTNRFSQWNWAALFLSHLVYIYIKVSREKMVKKIKERKGVGGQGRDKSLWLSLHTMVLIWISPYIADHQSEWCPWWSVVFVVPHMNSKNPRDTFSSFCLCLQSYLERDVLEWRNWEVNRSKCSMLLTKLLTVSKSI